MTYIAPDTTVYVCRNIPLDTSYKNTILFDSAEDQLSYFVRMAVYTFSAHSYQRAGRGKIRVQELADNLVSCNYLVFQNSAFGDKWFYCFITGAEYINNITTEITYEIDVMQTWLFNWSYDPCLVERQHTETDEVGEHVVLENLPFGDLICTDLNWDETLRPQTILYATGYDKEDHTPGGLIGGLPSGLNIYCGGNAHNYSDITNFCDFIQSYYVDKNREDAILSIWIQPQATSAVELSDGDDYDPTTNSTVYGAATIHFVEIEPPNTIDGYTPRNNKMFCYPYNSLCLDTGNETATYRWEWFSSNPYNNVHGTTAVDFLVFGSTCPNPEVVTAPILYNGDVVYDDTYNTLTGYVNYTEGVVLNGFPQVAWATDAYRAWVASGGYYRIGTDIATGVVGGLAGIATGNVYATASAVLGSSSSILSEVKQAQKGATGHGTQSETATACLIAQNVYYKFMQCQYDYAVMVDDYFTRYGYLLNKIMTPNPKAREHFTYIKTANCTIHGVNVPADDTARIEQIHDQGITFWMAPSYVGNYTLENTPVGE